MSKQSPYSGLLSATQKLSKTPMLEQINEKVGIVSNDFGYKGQSTKFQQGHFQKQHGLGMLKTPDVRDFNTSSLIKNNEVKSPIYQVSQATRPSTVNFDGPNMRKNGQNSTLNTTENIQNINLSYSRGDVFSADRAKRNQNKDGFYNQSQISNTKTQELNFNNTQLDQVQLQNIKSDSYMGNRINSQKKNITRDLNFSEIQENQNFQKDNFRPNTTTNMQQIKSQQNISKNFDQKLFSFVNKLEAQMKQEAQEDQQMSKNPGRNHSFYDTKSPHKILRSSLIQYKTNNSPLEVNQMLQTAMKNTFNLTRPKFGIKSYEVADNMHYEPYYKNNNRNNGVEMIWRKKDKKTDHPIDDFVKVNSWQPPAKYDIITDWSKNNQNNKKNCFLKAPRTTSTHEVMNLSKKKNYPGPIYKSNLFVGAENIGSIGQKPGPHDLKFCSFIEDAAFKSTLTPTSYLSSKNQEGLIDKRIRSWDQELKTFKGIKRIDKITKDKTQPAPGDYDTPAAFNKTQLPNRQYTLGKSQRVVFIDSYKNQKKGVPAPTAYKYDFNQAKNRLSMSPIAIRIKRH